MGVTLNSPRLKVGSIPSMENLNGLQQNLYIKKLLRSSKYSHRLWGTHDILNKTVKALHCSISAQSISRVSPPIEHPQADGCGGDLVNVPSLNCSGQENNSLFPTLRSNERILILLTKRYLGEEEFSAWANSIIQILFLKP